MTADMLDEGTGPWSAIEVTRGARANRSAIRHRHRLGRDAGRPHHPQPLRRPRSHAALRHRRAADTRRGRLLSRAAAADEPADPVARHARRDRRTRVRPAAVRRCAVRPHAARERADAGVDDRRRCSRVSWTSHPSWRDAGGRRRLRSRDGEAPRRRGVRRLARGHRTCRAAAASGAAAGAAERRAAAGRAAVRAAHRPRRRRAIDARLSRAGRGEHGARRPAREPHQPQSARGQGHHVRRSNRVRLPAPAGPVCPAGQRGQVGDRPGHSRIDRERSPPFAAGGRCRPTSWRLASRRSARLREELRDVRSGGAGGRAALAVRLARATTTASSCPASKASRPTT